MRRITGIYFWGGVFLLLLLLVACKSSNEGEIIVSGADDELHWTLTTSSAAFPARKSSAVISYTNEMWIIGGFNDSVLLNDVWHSSDGINWAEATSDAQFTPRAEHQSVSSYDKMWVIGGRDGSSDANVQNDIWSSFDGVNWTGHAPGTFSPRSGHKIIQYNNKLWLIGGVDASGDILNDVWSSNDGPAWNPVTPSASFSPRTHFVAFVYNNQMWVAGGFDESTSTMYYDSWYSTDGSTWTQGPDINPGLKGEVTVFQGTPYSIGGRDDSAFYNEQWQGTSMGDWTRINDAEFTPRHAFILIHNDRIWAVGGEGEGDAALNDVWVTQ